MARARTILKWTGVAACLLIVGAALVSVRLKICFSGNRGIYSLRGGAVTWWDGNGLRRIGWYTGEWQAPVLVPRYYEAFFDRGWELPLWIPLLAIGVPTAVLWRCSGRRLRGQCSRCGYSLAGLPGGTACPECGAAGDP